MKRKVKNLLAKADKEIERVKYRLKSNNKSLQELWEIVLEQEGLAPID